MSPAARFATLLRVGAAGVLVAVAFVPYVAVGEQPYAAIGFIDRINGLVDTRVIDGSWRVPPALALGASASALLAIALPRALRMKGQAAVALLSAVSAGLAYRLAAQSAILHPLVGPKLLVVGAALSFGAVVADRAALHPAR